MIIIMKIMIIIIDIEVNEHSVCLTLKWSVFLLRNHIYTQMHRFCWSLEAGMVRTWVSLTMTASQARRSKPPKENEFSKN